MTNPSEDMHHKDIFNRQLAIVLASLSVVAWLAPLLYTLVPHDKDVTPALFLAPVFLLWAMFVGLPRHGRPLREVWEQRRGWLLAGLAVFGAMELVALVVWLLGLGPP